MDADQIMKQFGRRPGRIDRAAGPRRFAHCRHVLHRGVRRDMRKLFHEVGELWKDALNCSVELSGQVLRKRLAFIGLSKSPEKSEEYYANGVGGPRDDVFFEKTAAHGERPNFQFN